MSCDADGGDPPSGGVAEGVPFPTLDLPWPDDVADLDDGEGVPFPTLGPPWPDGDAVDGEDMGGVRFPTLDAPWPDGDAADRWSVGEHADAGGARGGSGASSAGGPASGDGEDAESLPSPGPSSSEPASCRVPHRQVRPVHRRRSRHSFEPEDLSDADLDCLLRGSWSGDGPAGRRSSAGARSWSAWAKLALAAGVLLVVLCVVGVITAAGGTTDTITTRGQSRQSRPPPLTASPSTSVHPAPTGPPASPSTSVHPAPTDPPASPSMSSPPTTAAPPRAADPVPSTLPPASSATTARSCHPSYAPCVPVADDVDCAGGQGNGPAYLDHTVRVTDPDVYALDADNDSQGCE